MRYFIADAVAYEQARAMLNSAWGLPTPGTETSIPPPSDCLRDAAGKVYFSVEPWMCEIPPAPDVIAEAVASGELAEITEDEMLAAAARFQPTI